MAATTEYIEIPCFRPRLSRPLVDMDMEHIGWQPIENRLFYLFTLRHICVPDEVWCYCRLNEPQIPHECEVIAACYR